MSTNLFGSFTVGEQRHWSLLKGMASAFDPRGDTRRLYVFYATEDEDAYHALQDDWTAVGDDFRAILKANPAPTTSRLKTIHGSVYTPVQGKHAPAKKRPPQPDINAAYGKQKNVLVVTVGPRHEPSWAAASSEDRRAERHTTSPVRGACLGPEVW